MKARLSLFLFSFLVVSILKAQDCTNVLQWSASENYSIPNTKVVHLGVLYRSNFWTNNQAPLENNGPSGSGKPWTSEGTCLVGTSSSTTVDCTNLQAWISEKVYVGNDLVVSGTDVYKAKWWTQGNDPSVSSNVGTNSSA